MREEIQSDMKALEPVLSHRAQTRWYKKRAKESKRCARNKKGEKRSRTRLRVPPLLRDGRHRADSLDWIGSSRSRFRHIPGHFLVPVRPRGGRM